MKTNEDNPTVREELRKEAQQKYGVRCCGRCVQYIEAVEEVVNTTLGFSPLSRSGSGWQVAQIMDEVILEPRLVPYVADEENQGVGPERARG